MGVTLSQMREREAQLDEEVKMREHYKHEKEWQKGREKRVGDWRNFTGDPVKKRRVRAGCQRAARARVCVLPPWRCVLSTHRFKRPRCRRLARSWGWTAVPKTRARRRIWSLGRSTSRKLS